MAKRTTERLIADRYVLQRVLGRGGMGVVWRARDQLLGRDVAIKEVQLPPSLNADDLEAMRARVMREARAAARLNHPNVVTLYDVLQEEGRTFIVMELVEAPTLAAVVRQRGPMPQGEVAATGLQVLDALRAAHRVGIVHRDVKPGNVMVPSGDGRVKLADFGIASLAGDPQLTATGLVLGSPAYMAPEQASGQLSGPATDLWALGATMYFALEGEPPFERKGAVPTLTAVVNDPPRPMRRGGELEPMVLDLLAKSPAERPSAGQLRGRLERLAGPAPGSPTTTAPLPPPATAHDTEPLPVVPPPPAEATAPSQPEPATEEQPEPATEERPEPTTEEQPEPTTEEQPEAATAGRAEPSAAGQPQPATPPGPSEAPTDRVAPREPGPEPAPEDEEPPAAEARAEAPPDEPVEAEDPAVAAAAATDQAEAEPPSAAATPATDEPQARPAPIFSPLPGRLAGTPARSGQGPVLPVPAPVTPRQRPRAALVLALLGLALAGGLLVALLLGAFRADRGGESPAAKGGPAGSSPATTTAPETTAPAGGQTGTTAPPAAAAGVPAGFELLDNPKGHYAVAYPKGWNAHVLNTEFNTATFKDGKAKRSFEVRSKSPPAELLPASRRWEETLHGLDGYRLISQHEGTYQGRPAVITEYTYDDKGERLHQRHVNVAFGSWGYSVVMTARDSDWAAADREVWSTVERTLRTI
jgi:eukaryotic-like serine/threonine-protein kinase